MCKLYNEELKNRFLESYYKNAATQKTYRYVLSKATATEEKKNKDLCNFNYEELDNLFYSFSTRSLQSIQQHVAIITRYIEFAIDEGYNPTKINIVDLFHTFSGVNLEKYVNKIALNKKYVDKDELEEIINLCFNAQDAVIFDLIPQGIKGEDCEELINLRGQDCNFETNELLLTKNNGEQRIITVSSRSMGLIQDALDQELYIKNNGEETSARANNYKINKTEYVLRPASKDNTDKIKSFNIISRINRMKTIFGNPFITVTNLWVAGMIMMGKELKQEKGELTKEDYININKRFAYNPDYWYQTKVRIEKHL
jgi:hypothetical protein